MLKIINDELLSKIKIVGIHGNAGTGKDFIADNFYSDYFRISFADHFKCDVIGKGKYTYEQVFVTKEPEVRHGLQRIGTEEGRDVYGEDIWINCISAWIRTIAEKNKIYKFCIADVRFDNEAKFINSLGGYVFDISSNRVHCNMDNEAKKHSSESGISKDLLAFTIVNNEGTTLEEISDQLSNYRTDVTEDSIFDMFTPTIQGKMKELFGDGFLDEMLDVFSNVDVDLNID